MEEARDGLDESNHSGSTSTNQGNDSVSSNNIGENDDDSSFDREEDFSSYEAEDGVIRSSTTLITALLSKDGGTTTLTIATNCFMRNAFYHDWESIASAARQNANIKTLEFYVLCPSGADDDYEGRMDPHLLCQALCGLPRIEEIRLIENYYVCWSENEAGRMIPALNFAWIASLVSQYKHQLKKLCISFPEDEGPDWLGTNDSLIATDINETLAHALYTCACLEDFEWSDGGSLAPSHVKKLSGPLLMSLNSVKHLSISALHLETKSFSLCRLPIETLTFDTAQIDIKWLANILEGKDCKISKLKLTNCIFDDSGEFFRLARAISKCKSMTSLYLDYNYRLPVDFGESLLRLLRGNKSLKILQINICGKHSHELYGSFEPAPTVGCCDGSKIVQSMERIFGLEEFEIIIDGVESDANFIGICGIICKLNKAGRRYLSENSSSREAAVNVLTEVVDDIDCLFYHICENPVVLCGVDRELDASNLSARKRNRFALQELGSKTTRKPISE
jgi:hypothetical protein